MAENVPMIDMGSARLGMIVAERLRKKRKMTSTTSTIASIRVNLTSPTDSRMDVERSNRISRLTDAGITARKVGNSFLMESTTSTVFVPG